MNNPNQYIVFRCDAGQIAGIGHLKRCLVLAEEFSNRNFTIIFVAATGTGWVAKDIIIRRGYKFLEAGGTAGTSEDISSLLLLLDEIKPRYVVLDSHFIDNEYINACKTKSCIVTIEDDNQPSNSDIIIYPHLRVNYSTRNSDQLLLIGEKYNLIHKDMFSVSKNKSNKIEVVITFGGEDPDNHTYWIIDNLADILERVAVTIILGPAHPDKKSVIDIAGKLFPDSELIIDPENMASVFNGKDIAITAGGTTCYELSAARIAMLGIAIEEHQESLIDSLVDEGCLIKLGGYKNLDRSFVRSTVAKIIDDIELRNKLSDSAGKLFSQPGAGFIADSILNYKYDTNISSH